MLGMSTWMPWISVWVYPRISFRSPAYILHVPRSVSKVAGLVRDVRPAKASSVGVCDRICLIITQAATDCAMRVYVLWDAREAILDAHEQLQQAARREGVPLVDVHWRRR